MADRMLFIGWGTTVRGREQAAMESFNRAVGLYGRMQQDGRIERFDVVLLEPNGDLEGYIELHGSAEQIAAVKLDEEFRRMLTEATLIVDDLRMFEGFTDHGVEREMALYQDAISKVPQMS